VVALDWYEVGKSKLKQIEARGAFSNENVVLGHGREARSGLDYYGTVNNGNLSMPFAGSIPVHTD